ncbi:multidrug ABC transporter ATP-binding protein [Bordetella trematum]|uniref:ABC transporter ATP-binding protein n=1 Tax=Bordetella trematum TaxID=123899 RepID=A0A157SI39_9BORD|nr:ABC transporter ATP-binding protein [Bordetella trematum]AUL46296.1 multidrug ABC transporter ATP-binding protein [Bordetella trematum]AZR93066.1 multidrug ABC transporter ATP-binding protein [Bordetella trematum]NNH19315.1 ABC transporter ATP-binding protein [Bordetella trematum]QIM71666.1 ABC transporter ATP-binding protein [Bordetella trematum]SAI59417.1 ABC transporter ATP-binding protein [Bordetella trematum]
MAGIHKKPRSQAFRDVLGFSLRHWARQPWRLTAVALLALLSAVADVLTPMYAGRLVDAVASGAPSDQTAVQAALTAFWLLVALGVAGTLLRQGAFLNSLPFTLNMMRGMANESFLRVQRLSSDWHANNFAGSTVRKVTRGMWAVDLLNDTLLTALLPSVVMLVGATVVLGVNWPLMGLVVGLGAALYIAVTLTLMLKLVAPAARLSNAWDTRMGGALADAVGCNAVVKAFGAEAREEARLKRVIDKWRARTLRAWRRITFNGSIQGLMMTGLQTAMMGASLYLWMTGRASVGDITFAMTMFFVLKGYLREVGMDLRNLQRSVNDMEELVALHALPLGVDDAPDARAIQVTQGDIRFEDVTFRYGAQRKPLYRNFSMHIAPGERIGLVGHSGSGKTTFIKLIQRLYDLDEGRILIDGQDIALVRQASLRQQIAIVQQEPILFHRSLAENIAYARPDASRAEIEEAARQASAHDFIMALPKGYETLVGERGVKLSGGERQRVAIARAFLADAPILILDEATSSLDSESEVLIQQAMGRLMQGRTTLVVAHRLSTVRALDRLLVMDRGRVIEEGSHDALIRREGGVYRRLFERQALELTRGLEDVPQPA